MVMKYRDSKRSSDAVTIRYAWVYSINPFSFEYWLVDRFIVLGSNGY